MHRSALLFLALPLLGCPSEPGEPVAKLGAGEVEWEDLGSEAPVIFGPQGGYHIDSAVRIGGMDAGDPDDLSSDRNPTITYSLTWEGEDLLLDGFGVIVQGLDPIPGEGAAPYTHELLARRVLLDRDDDTLDGAVVELTVEVVDADGLEASDTVELTLYPHPLND